MHIYMHTYMRIPVSYVLSSAFCVLPTCSLHDRCHRDLEACGSHIVFNEQGMPYIGEGSLFMYKDGSDWIVTQVTIGAPMLWSPSGDAIATLCTMAAS